MPQLQLSLEAWILEQQAALVTLTDVEQAVQAEHIIVSGQSHMTAGRATPRATAQLIGYPKPGGSFD